MEFFATIIAGLLRPLAQFISLGAAKMSWPFLVSAALIAIFVYLRRDSTPSLRRARRFLLPKAAYTHISAIDDYKIWFANSVILTVLLIPHILPSAQSVSEAVIDLLGTVSILSGPGWEIGWTSRVAFTLFELLAIDAAFFFAHYLQHRVPFLWEFHKVHHSAERLNPFTVFRMHPVDIILHFTLLGTLAGGVTGIFAYLYAGPISTFAISGQNIGAFIFFVAGVHLRHSEIWVMYPMWIARHISSPAMHLIHHSLDPKHADKNMAQIFNFWDRMFGTLYLPTEEERLQFGLHADEHKEFRTLTALYLLPFRNVLGLRRTKSTEDAAPGH